MSNLHFGDLAQNYRCFRKVPYFSRKILLRTLIPKLTKVEREARSLSKNPDFHDFTDFCDFRDFSQFSGQISKNALIREIALGIGRKKWQKRNEAEVAKSRDFACKSANLEKRAGIRLV